MSKLVEQAGVSSWKLNTSPNGSVPGSGAKYIARKLSTFLVLAFKMTVGCVIHRPNSIYFSVSGGFGKIFEIPLVLIARAFGIPTFFHHHSFSYLNTPNWLLHTFLFLTPPESVHIVLCRKMGHLLQGSTEVSERNIRYVSNVAILGRSTDTTVADERLFTSVGYLGNISVEKGLVEFLEVSGELKRLGNSVSSILAGPFADNGAKDVFENAIMEGKEIRYIGPIYGEDKEAFFSQIDVLLFPSQYVNEAEPLTIHEALSHGVPVIAWERGCIGEILVGMEGCLIPQDKPFVTEAISTLQKWQDNSDSYQRAASLARQRYEDILDAYSLSLTSLIAEISGATPPVPSEKTHQET